MLLMLGLSGHAGLRLYVQAPEAVRRVHGVPFLG